MKILKYKFYVLYTICLIGLIAMFKNNTYMTHRNYDVRVVQLYQGSSSGKHSRTEFIAVLQDKESGIIFDKHVTASTYSQLYVGGHAVFNLRPFDVRQTFTDNLIWFFGQVVFFACMLAWTFIGGIRKFLIR